jgi:tetratricopeptide (TPR) repeat protein
MNRMRFPEWLGRRICMRTIRAKRLPIILFCLFLPGGKLAAQEDTALTTARSLIQQNKNEEAISQLKALTTRTPHVKGVDRLLGIAYYQAGRFLEAAPYLEGSWRENPNDRDVAQLLGLSYYSIGKPAEAIPPLEQVRRWRPEASMDAIYILGLCYILAKDYPKALESFADSYGVPAESAAAHLILARLLLRQGFDPIGENEAQKALSLSPQLPLVRFTLGEFDVYKADYPAAIRHFEAELAVSPAYAPAMTRLGDVYWRLGRHDEAERILRSSIWLDQTAAQPYVVLGKVLIEKRQFAMAERSLQQGIALEPGNYTAHYFLGQLYREMGRPDAAVREMRISAEIQKRETAVDRRNR